MEEVDITYCKLLLRLLGADGDTSYRPNQHALTFQDE